MTIRVGVIGAGSWGTTVAALACRNRPTVLWARRQELADAINKSQTNPDYLSGFTLPEALYATGSMEEAVRDSDVVVMAVPSHGFRTALEQAAPFVRAWVPVISLSKGLEADSLKRMTEIVGDVLPGHPTGVLTGPNLAKEILAGHPAASVVAIGDDIIAAELQRIFTTPTFRVYTNGDVIGCEISGVVKNVMAIAAGIADGLGFGDNTRATLVTRGLAELARLGVALGGQALTFAGLAGMGDLVATCISTQSRNHYVGTQLGKGRAIADVISEMNMVAEGVKSSPAVLALAHRHEVYMPIVEQMVAVLHEGKSVHDALRTLGRDQAGHEFHGII